MGLSGRTWLTLVSTLNTACTRGVSTCELEGPTTYGEVLDVLYTEGFIGGWARRSEGTSRGDARSATASAYTKETPYVTYTVYLKDEAPFSKVLGTESSREVALTWEQLDAKRSTGYAPLAKLTHRGPEVWVLKTTAGILSERMAHARHLGGTLILRVLQAHA